MLAQDVQGGFLFLLGGFLFLLGGLFRLSIVDDTKIMPSCFALPYCS
jgi:hypothetical protein